MKKTTVKNLRTALFMLATTSGCGAANGLVDAQCSPGYELVGNLCVAVQKPTEALPPAVASNETPIGPTNVTELDDGKSIGEDIVGSIPSFVGEVPLVCSGELVACRGECLPTSSDGQNCGACGKICPSNICVEGECVGSTPGDVVLLGHDFATAWAGSTQAAVLVNAVTIPTSNPIRILSYEEGAAGSAVENANTLVVVGTAARGRSVVIEHTADAALLDDATLARRHDVVLIHGTSASEPASIGARWANPLGSFVAKGGVLVAVDAGVAPIPTVLSSAGLLSVASHSRLPLDTQFVVSAPADVVGAQLLSPYAALGSSVSFQGAAPSDDSTWVVREKRSDGDPGGPVVIHRTVW